MPNVHFYNPWDNKFIEVFDRNRAGEPEIMNARINRGQDVSTPELQTDGNGYARIRWRTTECESGRTASGERDGLQQGTQITL